MLDDTSGHRAIARPAGRLRADLRLPLRRGPSGTPTSHCPELDAADDLAAETFVRAFAARTSYAPLTVDARALLFAIATNLMRDEVRRRGRDSGLIEPPLAAAHAAARRWTGPRPRLACGAAGAARRGARDAGALRMGGADLRGDRARDGRADRHRPLQAQPRPRAAARRAAGVAHDDRRFLPWMSSSACAAPRGPVRAPDPAGRGGRAPAAARGHRTGAIGRAGPGHAAAMLREPAPRARASPPSPAAVCLAVLAAVSLWPGEGAGPAGPSAASARAVRVERARTPRPVPRRARCRGCCR